MFTDKEITIADLAEKLRIAPSTVSRALNNHPSISEGRKKEVLALASYYGYRANEIARNLRTKQSRTIGLLVPRINSHFMSSVIAGIEHVINRNGYSLLISESSDSAKKESLCVKSLFRNRPDGLLVSLAGDTRELSHFDNFFTKETPVIFFHSTIAADQASCIVINNQQAGFDATTHLIREGCRRILCAVPAVAEIVHSQRFEGYCEALKSISQKAETITVDRLNSESGKLIANILLNLPVLPDGMFIPNDDCAVSCMLELKRAGIQVPKQIAFVGFGNAPVSMVVEPGLTSINYPGYEMGELAASNLISMLSGHREKLVKNTVLPSNLVIRGSSLRC